MYREIIVFLIYQIQSRCHFAVSVISCTVLTLYESVFFGTFAEENSVVIESVQRHCRTVIQVAGIHARYFIAVSVKAVCIATDSLKYQGRTACGASVFRTEIVSRVSVRSEPLTVGYLSVLTEVVCSSVYRLFTRISGVIVAEIIPRLIDQVPTVGEISVNGIIPFPVHFEQTRKRCKISSEATIFATDLTVFGFNVFVIFAQLAIRRVLIYYSLSSIRFDTVCRDRNVFPICLAIKIKCTVILIDLCEIKIGSVYRRIIHISTFFTQVTANEVYDTVFLVYRSTHHRHGTSVRMVMSRKYKLNTCGFGGIGNRRMIFTAASVRICIVCGLMYCQYLPCSIAFPGIRYQPCQCFVEIRTQAYACNIYIAVLYGIIVLIPQRKERSCGIAFGITVILMIAHCMNKAYSRKRRVENGVDLFPHSGISAVIHIVAGLNAEIHTCGVFRDFLQKIDRIRIGTVFTRHLRIADNNEFC